MFHKKVWKGLFRILKNENVFIVPVILYIKSQNIKINITYACPNCMYNCFTLRGKLSEKKEENIISIHDKEKKKK